MKIRTTQKELAAGLSAVAVATTARATRPIEGNIHVSNDKGRLRLYARNSEIAVASWLDAEVISGGATTIPAHFTSELVGYLKRGPVELTSDPETQVLTIQALNSVSTIRGIKADEYPAFPVPQGDCTPLVLDARRLKKLIRQVAFAAAHDEARPVLRGMETRVEKKRFRFVAADAFRLALGEFPLEGDCAPILPPAHLLKELAHLLPEDGTVEMRVSADHSMVFFSTDSLEFASPLIQGHFPDYQRLIPNETSATKAIVEREDFASALRAVSPFADKKIVRVTLSPDENGCETGNVTLEAISEELGSNAITIEASFTGAKQVMLFNVEFLLDITRAIEEKKLSIETNASNRPGIVRPNGSSNHTFVVMPMTV